jgi:hypothetical protein
VTASDPTSFLPADARFDLIQQCVIDRVDNSFTRGERRYAEFFGRRTDFFEHMNEIRSEFIGRSELLYVHAGLVVLLRRRQQTDHFRPLFLRLWREQGDFLRASLSLRWLVSTGDTLVDHGETAAQRALAMACVLFVNTVKLHESERHIQGLRDKELDVKLSPGGFLFDGLTCFSISDGDMISNMEARSRHLVEEDDIAGPLLAEVMRRVAAGPTVFRRLADLKKAAAEDPQRYRKVAAKRFRASGRGVTNSVP